MEGEGWNQRRECGKREEGAKGVMSRIRLEEVREWGVRIRERLGKEGVV